MATKTRARKRKTLPTEPIESEKPMSTATLEQETQEQAPPSAEGGEEKAEKKRRGRPAANKIDYPGLIDEDGNEIKLKTWPEDWSKKLHKPLRKEFFESEDVYLDHRAGVLEARAAEMRKEAEEVRTLGSAEDRKRMKKARAISSELKSLVAQLQASGMDVDLNALIQQAQAAE